MSMQDNEMDHLFRTKLEQLEVEPSEKVWKSIITELDGARQKRSFMQVMQIAAGITLVIAAGLFYLLNGKTALQYQADNNSSKKTNPFAKHTGSLQYSASAQADKQIQLAANITLQAASKGKAAVKHSRKILPTVKVLDEKQIAEDSETPVLADEQRQMLAAIANNQVTVSNPVVPDEPLAIKSSLTETESFKTQDKMLTTGLPVAKRVSKKHGIRSLGDLVNLVVAKVDKREDKLIEFTDTDDDGSVLTGLNLGIVRVKKNK